MDLFRRGLNWSKLILIPFRYLWSNYPIIKWCLLGTVVLDAYVIVLINRPCALCIRDVGTSVKLLKCQSVKEGAEIVAAENYLNAIPCTTARTMVSPSSPYQIDMTWFGKSDVTLIVSLPDNMGSDAGIAIETVSPV